MGSPAVGSLSGVDGKQIKAPASHMGGRRKEYRDADRDRDRDRDRDPEDGRGEQRSAARARIAR